MTLPAEVAALVDALVARVCEALGDNLVGVYLCGSLALGDFDPEKSDVDALVVTELPVSDAEMDRLSAFHASMPPSYTVPGRDYEVYYIDRTTLRRFAPSQRHVKIEPGEPLCRTEHRPGWVIERWVVRERGVTLAGPDPKSLIDSVSADELRWAAGEELRARLTNWSGGRWPITEMAHLGAQSFEVETACRALHTVQMGQPSSKREAVAWALGALPERWYELIEWSRRHKKEQTQDPSRVPEVLEFLRWAVEEMLTG